jgi:hypothetical protein
MGSERTSAFRVVVIGGTSGYAGARGFAKITNIGVGNNSSIQFHLLP